MAKKKRQVEQQTELGIGGPLIREWSQTKVELLQGYCQAYMNIMASYNRKYEKEGRSFRFRTCYIDAFAGPGRHIDFEGGQELKGSPIAILKGVSPSFDYHYFIESNANYAAALTGLSDGIRNTFVIQEDANNVLIGLLEKIEREVKGIKGICFLDPYGLDLDWKLVVACAKRDWIEVMINFPTYDMNRNALWTRNENLPAHLRERMNRFWGDSTWESDAYHKNLFGESEKQKGNELIVSAYKRKLEVAGFPFVAEPIAMRTQGSKGAALYYLFFASHKRTGTKIVDDMFRLKRHTRRQT